MGANARSRCLLGLRDALREFVGSGTGKVLDIGCGEGRISRLLRECGYHVTALDPVETLLDAARGADSADDYSLASAANLTFADASFDLVMAYNVLMDLDDVSGAIQEMRRVLKPGGSLLLSIVHPFADHVRPAADGDSVQMKPGSYFGRQRFEGTFERGGLSMHFAGWMQPLENYATALEHVGWRSCRCVNQFRTLKKGERPCSAGRAGHSSSG